ncbi:MAG: acyltransferase family protein [Janthinobacterium lividum]
MSNRLHYIDRCRALLMLLGIPYHAARMFSSDWGPAQGDPSMFCAVVAQTITEFRMPAFFLIAGYFAAMLLVRTPRETWLRTRIVRLGIPLATATIVVLPLQMLIGPLMAGGTASEILLAWWNEMRVPSQAWVSHLWFLQDLIVLSLMMTAAWPLVARARRLHLFRPLARAPFVAMLVAIGVVGIPLTLADPVIDASLAGHLANRLVHNGVFFLLGAGLFLRPEIFDRWLTWSWGRAGVAVAVIVVAVSLVLAGNHYRPGMLMGWIAAIGGAWLVLAAMKRWGDAPSPRVSMFVSASLTVYLVHHPIVLALGVFTPSIPLAPEAKWLAVVMLTLVLSMAFYLVIRRLPVVFYLFNGQRPAAIRASVPRSLARPPERREQSDFDASPYRGS